MRRVLLVAYHFPPSDQVGAQRSGRLARLLPTHGYQVDVVCASLERAVGSADPGQSYLVPDEGRVLRVDTPFVFGRNPYRSPDSGGLLKTLWWKLRARVEWLLVIPDWSWRWGQAALRAMESDIRAGTYEMLVLDAPPYAPLVPFLRLAHSLDLPTVCDFRDIRLFDPEPRNRRDRLSPDYRRTLQIRRIRDETIRLAHHRVFATEEQREIMRATYPDLDPATFSTMTNAFGEIDDVSDDDRLEDGATSPPPLRITYTGGLGYGRDRQVVDLIRGIVALRRRGGPEVELTLVARPAQRVERVVEEEGLADRVRTVGWAPRERATAIQRESDLLLLLQPSDFSAQVRVAIPAKLFEYMARRRHILGLVPEGHAARIIRGHGLGQVVSGSDPFEIAEALSRLASRVRERPFLPPPPEQYSESHTVAIFAEVMDRVLSRRSAPSDGE